MFKMMFLGSEIDWIPSGLHWSWRRRPINQKVEKLPQCNISFTSISWKIVISSLQARFDFFQAVVLFDEVDKAHPDVLTVLLQLFDEVNIIY